MQKEARARKPRRSKSEPVVQAPRPTYPLPPPVYALRVWSVKKVGFKWFISEAARFDDKEQWKGPYDTIHRATTAIARKMAEEVLTRHRRRCEHYGIND
jgi:hypothetical protein